MITIIIFFLAIGTALGMLLFRAWEIRTLRVKIPELTETVEPDLTFRHVERNMLYLTKHIVQSIVLEIAKYWFIAVTRTKKWIALKLPKVHAYFQKKTEQVRPENPSFFRRAVNESKMKIRRVRERVKRDHE